MIVKYNKKGTERFLKKCNDPSPWWKFWNRTPSTRIMTLWGVCSYYKESGILSYLGTQHSTELHVGVNGSERLKALIGDDVDITKPHHDYDSVIYGDGSLEHIIHGCFQLYLDLQHARNVAVKTQEFLASDGYTDARIVTVPFDICVPEHIVCFDEKLGGTLLVTNMGLTQANYDNFLSLDIYHCAKEKHRND